MLKLQLVLKIGLEVLQARVMILVPMAMAFGLFCWAMALHETVPLIVAGVFTVLVFLPTLFRVPYASQDGKAT